MNIYNAVYVVVVEEFSDAAKDFNNNPTTDAWRRLLDAMWARQALTSTEIVAVISMFETLPVSRWIAKLRESHEGKLTRT